MRSIAQRRYTQRVDTASLAQRSKPARLLIRSCGLGLAATFFLPAVRACDEQATPAAVVWQVLQVGSDAVDALASIAIMGGSYFVVAAAAIGLSFSSKLVASRAALWTLRAVAPLNVGWFVVWLGIAREDALYGLYLSFFFSLGLTAGVWLFPRQLRDSRGQPEATDTSTMATLTEPGKPPP